MLVVMWLCAGRSGDMVCDSGVTCDFSFFALKLSYSSIYIEKKKRQLQLSGVTLKLSSEIQGVV